MKGIILAGGLGTRLYPLTYATNKHLLPIYDEPMIFYPIRTLVSCGINEILIIVSGPHAGHFIRVLRNGKTLGVKHLEYAYQDKPDGGIADALALAEDFADKQNIAVILGDNTTDADISSAISSFTSGAMVFLKKVPDPQRFGVPQFDTDNTITQILEKPQTPPSDYAVTGLYLYDNTVFDKIRKAKPSDRGELEITTINNFYIDEKKLQWKQLNGFWSDAGTFKTLNDTTKYWAEKKQNGVW